MSCGETCLAAINKNSESWRGSCSSNSRGSSGTSCRAVATETEMSEEKLCEQRLAGHKKKNESEKRKVKKRKKKNTYTHKTETATDTKAKRIEEAQAG